MKTYSIGVVVGGCHVIAYIKRHCDNITDCWAYFTVSTVKTLFGVDIDQDMKKEIYYYKNIFKCRETSYIELGYIRTLMKKSKYDWIKSNFDQLVKDIEVNINRNKIGWELCITPDQEEKKEEKECIEVNLIHEQALEQYKASDEFKKKKDLLFVQFLDQQKPIYEKNIADRYKKVMDKKLELLDERIETKRRKRKQEVEKEIEQFRQGRMKQVKLNIWTKKQELLRAAEKSVEDYVNRQKKRIKTLELRRAGLYKYDFNK